MALCSDVLSNWGFREKLQLDILEWAKETCNCFQWLLAFLHNVIIEADSKYNGTGQLADIKPSSFMTVHQWEDIWIYSYLLLCMLSDSQSYILKPPDITQDLLKQKSSLLTLCTLHCYFCPKHLYQKTIFLVTKYTKPFTVMLVSNHSRPNLGIYAT